MNKGTKKRTARPSKEPNVSAKSEMMQKLKKYVRAHAQAYLQDPNITSVGIGFKEVKGKTKPELALQFSVRSKVTPQALGDLGWQPIPASVKIDGLDVPTDVVERTFSPSFRKVTIQAKDERRARVDPVQPGVSVGGPATTAGTLGTFVRDQQSQRIFMLSNWHVLQGDGGILGGDVVQPGKHDDNQLTKNIVGKVVRSHLGPAGDCAIASISGRAFSNEILGLKVSVGAVGEAELGDIVVKSGRTTAITYGVVTRVEVNTSITYPGGKTCVVGGFEIGVDKKHKPADGEISRGGDSGSAWMATDNKGKATNIMLGLHFAGDDDKDIQSEWALACYAKSVMEKLEVQPLGEIVSQAMAQDVNEEFRQGFDRNFLPFQISTPTFTGARSQDLAALDGQKEIPYCHFSVWLSKARKYPLCVAWNIDGGQFKRLNRKSFRTDRRGDLEDYQLTNDIYLKNVLDRGHIARRADLCWGSLEEAEQGNYDSFYYTNIAPQHEAFNQSENRTADPEGGLWGRLENTVFDSENPQDLRISLMGGPVFSKDDQKFTQNDEECFLPREYWKVVAYVDDTDGKEKVFGFLLTQASLVAGLVAPQGLNFDEWLWARITLEDLEEKTGVKYPKALKDREVKFVKPQSLGGEIIVKPIFNSEEYFK